VQSSPAVIAHRDAGMRSQLRKRLESKHRIPVIAECASGVEAIHWIEVLRPGAVVLDVAMPDLTGAEVLAWLLPEDRPAMVYMVDELGRGA
jgi:two-component system, LytTR family, response regulator